MVTKYKAAVFIIAVMFSSIVSAAYTTMTIEGVKQANGVWTAAGVMDTSGFVRTTGAVTIAGTTASTAVSLPVEKVAATNLLKGASKALGPVALAMTAYDVYEWFTSGDVSSNGNSWTSDLPIGNCKYNGYTNSYPDHTLPSCLDFILKAVGTGYTVEYQYTDSNGKMAIGRRSTTCSSQPCPISNVGYFFPLSIQPEPPQSAFDRIPIPSFPVMSSGFNKIPSLAGQPIPITGLQFPPFSSWLGDPYFKDGNWYRDRMDISPSPTPSQPIRVRVDVGPVKIEGQTNPNVTPDTGPAGGNTTPKEKPTFCEANPMSIACAEMGELKDEKLEVEERPVDVSYTPWGSSTSQCPADKLIPLWEGQSIAISYSPVCQFASLLRPLVIALAFVAAGFIVAGITRKGAES